LLIDDRRRSQDCHEGTKDTKDTKKGKRIFYKNAEELMASRSNPAQAQLRFLLATAFLRVLRAFVAVF